MANQMKGPLRVDNDIDRRTAVDPGAVQQLPGSHLPQLAGEAASIFSNIGAKVGALADAAAAKEGTEAGRLAGLDPEFRTVDNGTIRGNAFDAAGLDIASTRLTQQINSGFDAAYAQHAADPIALGKSLSAQEAAVMGHAPRELRPALMLHMQGKRLQYAREQARQQAAERQSEAAGAFETEQTERLKTVHQMAYSLGLDPQADEALAAQTALYAKSFDRRGPDGKLYVMPEDAAKQIRKVDQTVATARLSGAFDRLSTLDAKRKFITDLENDYRSGKGLASVYDLDQFDRVKAGLMADYRAAKTLQATQIEGAREGVKKALTWAKQGNSPGPDEMAALKTQVQAVGDAKLAGQLDVAEQVLDLQRTSRRKTPVELQADVDALQAKVSTDANATDVTKLEVLSGLLTNMRAGLKNDPNRWAETVGLVPKLPPLTPDMLTDPARLSAAISQRVVQSKVVGEAFSQPPKYLSNDVKQLLATALAQGGTPALAVMKAVADGAGDAALPIYGELGKSAPVLASIGSMVADGGDSPPHGALLALDTIARRRELRIADGKALLPGVAPKKAEENEALTSIAGDAFAKTPESGATALDLAKAIYENLAAQNQATAYNPDLFKRALRMALGEDTVNNVTYGGVVPQDDGWFSDAKHIVLPSSLKQSAWRDAIQMIAPEDLTLAGIGQPVTESGQPIPLDRIKGGTLVQVGDSRYAIALGDTSKPGQEWFVRQKTGDAKPEPLILDFRKLSPVLRKRRPDLFR